jgi:hypothetical protein
LYFFINIYKNTAKSTADNIKKQKIFRRKYTFRDPSTNRLVNRDAVVDIETSLRDGRSRNRGSIPGRRIKIFLFSKATKLALVSGQLPIHCRKRKFRWIGHTLRKEDGEIPKAALLWKPQ